MPERKKPSPKTRRDERAVKKAIPQWPFRLAAAILVPALFLAAIELTLRIAGYGYDAGFFQKRTVGGRDYFINNEKFSLRFFPKQLARWAHPVRILAEKPPDIFRIFVMGESAAQGDPEPAFAASRYLEALLRDRYPSLKIEVANVAFTAINSHVILPIAHDCARKNADAWIIYMGNNEMIGPFGAATVFGMRAPPLPLVRANVALQRLRLGQWITDTSRKIRSKDAPESWAGMEMFLANQLSPLDPRKAVVYRNFEANLAGIVDAGLRSGAKVLLNTVAVNLEDCPPFASGSNTSLDPKTREKCDELYKNAVEDQTHGRFTEAAAEFEQIAHLDSPRADVEFRLGQCFEALTNPVAAAHFQAACDLDALPFRTDSAINEAIRKQAQKDPNPNLTLCDAATAFANLPHMGSSLFYEHVHLNFDGNYRLARMWAEKIQPMLPEQVRAHPSGGWAAQDVCEKRLALTEFYRRSVYDIMIGRFHQPPLNGQMNNATRLAALEERVGESRRRSETQEAARQICAQAIAGSPDDYILHEISGAVLQGMGAFKESGDEWRAARELMPSDRFAYLAEGQMLERQQRLAEARDRCEAAASLYPDWADPWLELGKIDSAEDKGTNAIENYQRALRLDPVNVRALFFMGKTLSHLHRPIEAIEALQRAVRLKPEFAEAQFALGNELGMQGKLNDAREHLEAAILAMPDYAAAHLNLGVALLKLNDVGGARRELTEALRLEPDNKFAQSFLRQIENAPSGLRN
jgi:tetratricopeptide (TPR) repeat protein